MTKKWLRAATLALAMAVRPATAPSADVTVDTLWQEIQSVPWGTPYPVWQRGRPSDRCEPSRSTGAYGTADEQWCHRCERAGAHWTLGSFFYAFGSEAPPTCRLEQVRLSVTGSSSGDVRDLHQALAQRLTGRYGPAEEPRRGIGEFGSASWRDVRRWRSANREIYLYVVTEPDRSAQLRVLARDGPLLRVLAEDEQRRDSGDWDWLGHAEARLDLRLGESVRGAYPDLPALLATLLRQEREAKRDAATRERARATIVRLLEDLKRASPASRPVLLLAADRLATYVTSDEAHSLEWDEQRKELARYGVRYQWAPLGAVWVYSHDLLWRVWRESPAMEWGEHAFLLLLERGWDTTPTCGGGSDQFRSVIRYGEEFLARYPRSTRRPNVFFALARAYETWWSLSQASPQDEYVVSGPYQAGAKTARERAIAYYEQVIRTAPTSHEAGYARRQVPRLKLGVATNQRSFYCIYD